MCRKPRMDRTRKMTPPANAAIGKVEAKPGSLRGPNAGIGISQAGPGAAMAESVAKLAAVTRRTAGLAL